MYNLEGAIANGGALLAFYPCDFSPVCRGRLCKLRDVEWFAFRDGFSVLGISKDSLYAHEEFIRRHEIPFPLLSDTDGSVTEAYGLEHDHWEAQPGLPRRAFVVVDEEGVDRYRAVAEDANDVPDLDPLHDAVERVASPELV
jgi:peroxiredoxin